MNSNCTIRLPCLSTMFLALVTAVGVAVADASQVCHHRVQPPSPESAPSNRERFTTHSSLRAARDTVRGALQSGWSGDLVVCLGEGTHVLASPLAFTAEDTPPNGRVVWRGAGNNTVVSGGVAVTGWAPATLGGAPVLAAPVPAAAAGSGPTGVIRQLWVNDRRASRVKVSNTPTGPTNASSKCTCDLGGACIPSQRCTPAFPTCVGFVPNKEWGKCTAGGGPGFPAMTGWASPDGVSVGFTAANPADPILERWAQNSTQAIEFTWPIVIRNWIEPRCTVASISGGNITLASPCGGFLVKRTGKTGPLPPPVVVEAAPHFPLSPGSFYHSTDSGVLYYAPLPGETAGSVSANAWVAAQEVLVSYDNVSNHVWEGVQFSHATWHQANTADGFVDSQTAVHACTAGTPGCNMGTSGEPTAAVRIAGCSDVAITGCSFQHIGQPYALSIGAGSHRVGVRNCTFTDLSGGFVKAGSVDPDNWGGSTNPDEWDALIDVTDNVASGQAVEYGGAAGFFGGYLFSADISHNTVSEAGYSGFSLGWGWGTVYPPGFGNNTVSYNRIFDVMTKMKDGGGIYINGATNGSHPSTVHHNWVTRDEHVFAVYYCDNGCSHYTFTQNVATNSSVAWAYFFTGGPGPKDLAAQNDSIDHFWYEGDADPVNNCKQYNCVEDHATIYKIVPPQTMPAEAIAIENGAGARSAGTPKALAT